MDSSQEKFELIAEKLSAETETVQRGKMMSSPGITYRGKVFAFYYKEQMVFRLGKGYDLEADGITKFSLLNPFKNQPPLAGWFEVPFDYSEQWETLARKAMNLLKSELE